MTTILDRIEEAINATMPGRIYVLNPANTDEDLSERWDDPKQYAAFIEGMKDLKAAWNRLTVDQTLEKSVGILEGLAGEPTKEAFRKQARDLQATRNASLLKTRSAGTISALSGASGRTNTFHGKE